MSNYDPQTKSTTSLLFLGRGWRMIATAALKNTKKLEQLSSTSDPGCVFDGHVLQELSLLDAKDPDGAVLGELDPRTMRPLEHPFQSASVVARVLPRLQQRHRGTRNNMVATGSKTHGPGNGRNQSQQMLSCKMAVDHGDKRL